MSWGTELWDQFERVTDHTQRGIEFSEKFSHYIKDRAKVESEYAAALKKLAKNYSPKRKSDESPFTVAKSFHDSLKEIVDMAGQHDQLAEHLKQKILEEVTKLTAELRVGKKKQMDRAKHLETQLQNQMKALDSAKKKYARAHNDHVLAEDQHRAADENLNLSRAEVEKAKNLAVQRGQFCNDCKAGYAQLLEQTNANQRDYYNKYLPQVFQSLQELDENRIVKVQESIRKMSDEEKSIQPIINTCLVGIATASEKIDHGEDSRRVIDMYKSGFAPPEDIGFEDLSNKENSSIHSNSRERLNRDSRTDTVKSSGGTIKAVKAKKEKSTIGRIFGGGRASEPEAEDFSHLPPNQRKKQLKEKIKSIKHQITKEGAEREGMVKLQEVYRGNPKMGDVNVVTSQLEDHKKKLDALEAELIKFENYMTSAEGGTPVMVRRSSAGSSQSTNSGDVSTPASTINGTTPNSMPTPVHETPNRQTTFDDPNDSFDEEPDSPIVGKAMALYQFDAATSGSLSMIKDEELFIIDYDNGDGWTRIRKPTGDEGFVPTTYIEIH